MIFAFLIQCAVSFVSVVAFAVLFHAPRQEWAWCGLTGMAGWAAYWLLVQMEQGVVTASLVAAVVLALLSRILAVVRRCPMTVFIMGGFVPAVGVQVAKDTVKSCCAEMLQKNGMTIGSCRF